MPEHSVVKGAEFERRLRRLARRNKVACEFVAAREREATAGCISVKNSPLSRIGGRS